MNTVSRLLYGAAFAGLTLLTGMKADAQAITPVFTGATPIGGGLTAFTYDIVLGADSTATASNPTSGLTFFDFKGLTGMPTFVPSAAGATFTISEPLTGVQAPNPVIGQTDNPTLPNVDLVYTGSTIVDSGPATTALGTLTIDSTGVDVGLFTGFSSISQKTSSMTIAANQSYVEGPNLPTTTTPEPGTFAMLTGMGLSAGIFLRRRRK